MQVESRSSFLVPIAADSAYDGVEGGSICGHAGSSRYHEKSPLSILALHSSAKLLTRRQRFFAICLASVFRPIYS